MYKKSIFIFRRDLRLNDNIALKKALSVSKDVFLCFILDPAQIEKNSYKSQKAVDFMIECIFDLDEQLKNLRKTGKVKNAGKLHVFYGKPEDVLGKIIPEIKAESVFVNKDYTPFSMKRDQKIKEICKKENAAFESFDDSLLNPPGSVVKNDGSPYVVFTPFYKKALAFDINVPVVLSKFNFNSSKINDDKNRLKELHSGLDKALTGGRDKAVNILKNAGDFKDYEKTRDFPFIVSTTKLSAYIKFGAVSVREVYHYFKKYLGVSHPLIRQLYWRDFWIHIAYHFLHVFGSSFYKKYDSLKWENNDDKFKAWCEGKTGFPIVDAGMRELNKTGFMHNRVRMITASFLVKDLHIDWRKGEKYFAQKLIDYDPCVNNGNWQWAASTGCDAQPYFRIFNPWRQQERFDFDCEYIKKWVPELNFLNNKEIHNIHKSAVDVYGYPKPIVDHKTEAGKAKSMYLNAGS